MKYSVVLRQKSWNGKLGCKVRSTHATRAFPRFMPKRRAGPRGEPALKKGAKLRSDGSFAALAIACRHQNENILCGKLTRDFLADSFVCAGNESDWLVHKNVG